MSTGIEEIFQPGIGPVIGAVLSAFFAANTVFFRWLISSFREVRTDIKTQTERTNTWLDNHEGKDQNRHEENLYRFEKISVALAKLGSDNGSHHKEIK